MNVLAQFAHRVTRLFPIYAGIASVAALGSFLIFELPTSLAILSIAILCVGILLLLVHPRLSIQIEKQQQHGITTIDVTFQVKSNSTEMAIYLIWKKRG